MKKILVALAVAGFSYLSADAQTTQTSSCGVTHDKVCRKSSGNEISCYKTKYAENFKVCKGDLGYFICCETPGSNNATHPGVPYVVGNQFDNYENEGYVPAQRVAANTVPVSQSYPEYNANRSSSYEGYYPQQQGKGKMRVCNGGNTVADQTRAPYEGCPSPQSDGPDANNQRNVNVVTPVE